MPIDRNKDETRCRRCKHERAHGGCYCMEPKCPCDADYPLSKGNRLMPNDAREKFTIAASNVARLRASIRNDGCFGLPPTHPRMRDLKDAEDAFDNAWRVWEGTD